MSELTNYEKTTIVDKQQLDASLDALEHKLRLEITSSISKVYHNILKSLAVSMTILTFIMMLIVFIKY